MGKAHSVQRPPCELLREARERAGKSQADIADECDVTQPCVHRWEYGETMPRNIARVAAAYGVSAKRLIAAFVAERQRRAV